MQSNIATTWIGLITGGNESFSSLCELQLCQIKPSQYKQANFLDMLPHNTLQEALCDIKQTEPVNSNTANLCCSLLLFWKMPCGIAQPDCIMYCGEYRRTLFVLSVAAVCVLVCKNMFARTCMTCCCWRILCVCVCLCAQFGAV